MDILKGAGSSVDLVNIRQVDAPKLRDIHKPAKVDREVEFSSALAEKIHQQPKDEAGLKFSMHAQKRMHSRSIDLSPEDFVKMQEAIQRAKDKGSRESLILTDKAAFVVSVKNNTVITAVDKESLKDNVFTNIDSTIMI